MYRLLQSFLRLVSSIFFRHIEVVGLENIPKEGAVIFAGNHPNSLMDPVLVIAYGGRVVHFAAKDVLFRSRFLRFFLRNLGAVPIQRRQDHGGEIDNDAAFSALFQVLEEGRAMGIFPEGLSHTESQLSRLKTGTARIALHWVQQHGGTLPLHIVPVGLTYLHRQRFRSQVLIQFGAPIPVHTDWLPSYQSDPKAAVQQLTELLEQHMRALTINAPDWSTLQMIHTARRLYKPSGIHLDLPVYAELTRRMVEGYQKAESHSEIQQLRQQLEQYQARLERMGLEDHHLRKGYSIWRLFWRLFGRFLSLFLLLPLAIPGMILHAPIMMTAVVAGDHLTARKDVVATTKLVTSILMVPLLYLVILFVLWQFLSPMALVWVAILLPASGFATIRLLERQLALLRSSRGLWRWFRLRRELDDLRQYREQLAEAIDSAVEKYHDPSKPRIFEKSTTPGYSLP